VEKRTHIGAELKPSHAQHGLRIAGSSWFRGPGDELHTQPLAGHLQALHRGNIDAVELDGRVEPPLHALDNALPNDGFRMALDIPHRNDETDNAQHNDAREPLQPAFAPPRFAVPRPLGGILGVVHVFLCSFDAMKCPKYARPQR
jgi:hypothetical protein